MRTRVCALVLCVIPTLSHAYWYGTGQGACDRMTDEQVQMALQDWADRDATLNAMMGGRGRRNKVVRTSTSIKVVIPPIPGRKGDKDFTIARYFTSIEGCLRDVREQFAIR